MSIPWKLAANNYQQTPGEMRAYELMRTELQLGVSKGYPIRITRWRELEKNIFEVEVWFMNDVKTRGVLGKAISKLMARYQLRRKKTKDGTVMLNHGVHESWFWNGKPRQRYEYDSKRIEKDSYGTERELVLYHHRFDEQSRLVEYFNARIDINRPRIAKFNWGGGLRRVIEWRGKFHSKDAEYDGTLTVKRNVNGKPLDDSADILIRTYTKEGWLQSEETHVAKQPHGFKRIFNKFGRIVNEEYWVRGTQVPEWVYLDPKSVTPEEIQAEPDEELREIMLELQGTELYQTRIMARGMRAIARTRLACEDAEMSAELLSVRRPTLVEAKK